MKAGEKNSIIKTSYAFDTFRDQSHEASLLEIRANKDLKKFIADLENNGLINGMRILEVGSGTGLRAQALAERFNKSEILGIDNSNELLKYSRERTEGMNLKNLSFVKSDVLSASSLTSLGKFDFAHIRLVIQHLNDPLLALRNVKNSLNLRGVVFLEDTDRDWMAVVPSSKEWDDFYLKVKASQKDKGGDPNSGTKLGHYLSQTGFEDVQVHLVPVCGGNTQVKEWLDVNVPTFYNYVDDKTLEEGKKVVEKMKIQCGVEPMFFYQTWFQASGKKAS